MTDTYVYDGRKAREEAKKNLPLEFQQILAEYDYLIGHPGSEALCECLSELLGGLTVRYCGGLINLGVQKNRLNVKVDKNGLIRDLYFG